jgi:hypothetical protein
MQLVGFAMGINNLLEVFNEKYYENLEGVSWNRSDDCLRIW